jgi:endonuclease-8
MYGTWHVYRPGEPWRRPESEARLVLEVADAVVVNFSAPVIELLEERVLPHHTPIAALGPDLLADTFDAEEALRRFRDPSRATLTIGDAIMDQRVMAGVGNIWKHETLFRCGLNPWRKVGDLDDTTLRTLISTARELLWASAGRPGADGKKPHRPRMFVYARAGQPCLRCHTRIRSAPQGNDIRQTAWCPRCQPLAEGQPEPVPRRRSVPVSPPSWEPSR